VSRAARLTDGLIEAGIVGLLLFAPLPFGSVLPWAQAVVEVIVALLLALCLGRMLKAGEIALPFTPLLWPGLAMTGVIGLQLLVPAGSVHPHATWESLRLYAAYFGFLLVLATHLTTKARIVRLLVVLVGWGVLLAVLGLVNQMLGRAVILWFPKHAYLDRLTSTFVNPNHQAFYFAPLLFLALGLLLRPRAPASFSVPGAAGSATRPPGERLRALPVRLLLGGAIVVLGLALVLTASRGGLISALAGGLVVIVLGLRGRGGPRLSMALAGAALAFGIYASWVGVDPVVDRFSVLAKDPFTDYRWPVWEATLRMAGDAPFLGVGLGAFQDGFARYRPLVIPSNRFVDYAHNDYLQLLAETGIVGLLVAAGGLFGLGAFVLRRWMARHDPFVRGLTLGGVGALSAMIVHGAVDFALHMPANALLVVVVAALLPAIVTLRAHRSGYRVDPGPWSRALTPRGRVVLTGGLIVALLSPLAVVPGAVADWYVRRAQIRASEEGPIAGVVVDRDRPRAVRELERAGRLDPWNPSVHAALATVSEELAVRVWNYRLDATGRPLVTNSPEGRFEASQPWFARAYEGYTRSLGLRPRGAEIHYRLGWLLGHLERVRLTLGTGLDAERIDPRLAPLLTSRESLLPRALAHLREAIHWDPNNVYHHRGLALLALAHLRDNPTGRQAVVDGFREALTLRPAFLPEVLDRLTSTALDRDLLVASIPKRHDLWLAVARELDGQGRREAAASAFQEALGLASDRVAQREVRLAYSAALLRAGKSDQALVEAREALVLEPKRPETYVVLGTLYEARKRWEEAEFALASALSLAADEKPGEVNEYRARLASFLSRRGERERALVLRRQIVRESPNDPWAHLALGRLLEERGEWSEAYREYQAAEGLGPNDPSLHQEVARAYLRNGLLREAARAYEAAVSLKALDAELQLELARVYARIGSPERAVEHYRRVLARQPDHEGARRGLASLGVEPGIGAIR
jgi:tetratricopeptide (TPR) repeat protein/O-antigen ligase